MIDHLTRLFDGKVLFSPILFLTALLFLAFAIFLFRVDSGNVERMEKISRWKIPGWILGVFVLAWCVPHTAPILPESLHKYLIPAMAAAAVAAWFVLDHLFARALGGFMILSAHLFLRETFGVEGFSGPVSALLFLLYGTCGIVLCGLPYRLRDLVRLELDPRYRWSLPAVCLLFFLGFLILGIRSLRYF